MATPATFHDEGHGFDLFGLSPAAVARAVALGAPAYERYFRVASEGSAQVPRAGAAILVANHSGTLPVDGAMLWQDVVRHTGRVPRMIADRFIPRLPFVSTWFARVGVVSGTRGNVRRLLEQGELLAIFPEGVTGVGKSWRDRYRLQAWRVGHAELAIRHRAPVIPVAIVGAEESWPVALRIDGVRLFGAPYLPIPATPLPLPVRYHLRYGAPIALHDAFAPDDADDPAALAAAAAQVRAAVEALIAETRTARRGLWR
ncbi:MAG: acyltransferase family protein [Kofleriaceae bacterium]|nr:acyltransferase family protein [Myxococcales bacterium]MCB9561512.1 acyltransferase family protein [Kofleriaceae bacterium]